jgi:transposase
MQYIAFDSHKRYTLASVEAAGGGILREARIPHEKGIVKAFLGACEAGSPVAIEAVGNWYWIVDEIEAAGMVPRLVHPRKAKLMMGMVNKTDKLDARGMNRLQRNKTLPTVWIPPGELRDQRDLPRTRMVLVQQRTRLKNRIRAALAKYALGEFEADDIFGPKSEKAVRDRIQELPPQTRYTTELLLEQLSSVKGQVEKLERRMQDVFRETDEIRLLLSLPGVGPILAVVVALEVGEVDRFPSAACLASYAGTTPRVHASGGKTRYGRLRPDTNHYLKWAFVEAANAIVANAHHWPNRHVVRLYQRIKERKGHPKAAGAMARHLAEATYWVLKKRESYKEPESCSGSSAGGQARSAHEPKDRFEG